MDLLSSIDALLQRVRSGELRSDALAREVRVLLARDALPGALPPRYAQVLDQLLDRLESSALFSEESCSFSQRDLLDGLAQWLSKAKATLGGG